MGLGLLFLHLGGAWLTRIAHWSLGLPGVSTLQHAHPTKPLLISSHLPTASELHENITVSLNTGLFSKESSILTDALSETSTYVLMFDEIKIEEVVCYSATNNHIVSVCHRHSGGYAHMKHPNCLREWRKVKFILPWRWVLACFSVRALSDQTSGYCWCAWILVCIWSYLQLMPNSYFAHM